MRWIVLAFQLFASHRSLVESRAFLEKAKDAAEKSKKMAFFSFSFLLALIYFITGTIVAVISLGLQLDDGNGLHWNGLMWAATALVIFALMIVGAGAVVLKFPKDDEEEAPKKGPQVKDLQELKVVAEQLAVTFLTQLTKNLTESNQVRKEAANRPNE